MVPPATSFNNFHRWCFCYVLDAQLQHGEALRLQRYQRWSSIIAGLRIGYHDHCISANHRSLIVMLIILFNSVMRATSENFQGLLMRKLLHTREVHAHN